MWHDMTPSLGFMIFWRIGGKGTLTESINELLNESLTKVFVEPGNSRSVKYIGNFKYIDQFRIQMWLRNLFWCRGSRPPHKNEHPLLNTLLWNWTFEDNSSSKCEMFLVSWEEFWLSLLNIVIVFHLFMQFWFCGQFTVYIVMKLLTN